MNGASIPSIPSLAGLNDASGKPDFGVSNSGEKSYLVANTANNVLFSNVAGTVFYTFKAV